MAQVALTTVQSRGGKQFFEATLVANADFALFDNIDAIQKFALQV